METMERIEFYERFGFKPARLERLNIGDVYIDKHGKKFEVLDIAYSDWGHAQNLIFSTEGEQMMIDLAPHWERGPEGKINLNRDGVAALITAVYSQAEKDLEELYASGLSGFKVENLDVYETPAQKKKRAKSEYERRLNECETLLGSVFSKYTRIKAYYKKLSMSIDEIAIRMNENPEHIANIVERLGLNDREGIS